MSIFASCFAPSRNELVMTFLDTFVQYCHQIVCLDPKMLSVAMLVEQPKVAMLVEQLKLAMLVEPKVSFSLPEHIKLLPNMK